MARRHAATKGARWAPFRALAGLIAVLAAAAPAVAINDLGGTPIANTTPGQQATGGPSVSLLRGTPFSDPTPTPSPNSPEEDLAAALETLRTTGDIPTAEAARLRAIAILEGTTSGNEAYAGIPLLNVNPASKTKVVPASGPVVVTLVRFGEHQISDTWLLDFSQRDPNLGFEIQYQITELGGAEGGDLTPTPLLVENGTPLGGVHSVVAPLGLGELALGTFQTSRFTSALAGGNQPLPPAPRSEHSRIATQTVTVRMPPPKHLSVVLDPNLRPDHEAVSVIRPVAGVTPPAVTIGDLDPTSPERQIHAGLATAITTGQHLTDANNAAPGLIQQLATMRVKSHLPPGGGFNTSGVDLVAVFSNNEVYLSRTSVRMAPNDSSLSVRVYNRDGFAHTVQALGLDTQQKVLGATTWGQFGWNVVPGGQTVAPGDSQVLTFSPTSSAFTFVIGDPNSGDQARSFLTLDRTPDQQSFKVPGPAFAFPLHDAVDAQGNIWITLAGVDRIARLTPPTDPAAPLETAQYVEYHLPPPPPISIAWEPVDIQVDSQGIVWATLAAGNAILRLDPSIAESCDPRPTNANCNPSTIVGIEIINLDPCPEVECRQPPPPAPPELSREPGQMTVRETPQGTEVWFTELLADKIGVVRWRPASQGGPQQQHFTCACKVPSVEPPFSEAGTPSGIDVDSNGHIWFAGANKNTIARLIPPADPFATSVASILHFNIPSGVEINEPEIGGTFITSAPHSVDVDDQGRVWFTQLAIHKVGYLDPALAVKETTAGMREFELGRNGFGSLLQPADLTPDASGTVYVADEYGDQITAVTACGQIRDRYVPTRRLSFTDQPLVDDQGNLWFLEAGANLITRISRVAALPGAADTGASCPPPPPPPGGGTGQPTSPQGTPPGTPTVDLVKVACAKRHWVFGTQKAPRVLLLGNTPAQVTSCLGRPTAKKGGEWTYGSRIKVTFTRGKVTGFTLLNSAFRSAVGNVGVGSRIGALGRMSTAKLTFNRAASTYTAVLPLSTTQRARVVYTVKGGKVSRVAVTAVKR